MCLQAVKALVSLSERKLLWIFTKKIHKNNIEGNITQRGGSEDEVIMCSSPSWAIHLFRQMTKVITATIICIFAKQASTLSLAC